MRRRRFSCEPSHRALLRIILVFKGSIKEAKAVSRYACRRTPKNATSLYLLALSPRSKAQRSFAPARNWHCPLLYLMALTGGARLRRALQQITSLNFMIRDKTKPHVVVSTVLPSNSCPSSLKKKKGALVGRPPSSSQSSFDGDQKKNLIAISMIR